MSSGEGRPVTAGSLDAPTRPGARIAGVVIAAAGVALAAQVSVPVPGSPVPQSLQTLAVVLAGAWLGPVRGALALFLYVGLGAAGLPVFADGARGAGHLVGPTAGYLVGFVAAAWLLGWWAERGWCRTFATALGGMLLGHAVILLAGWLRLALLLGPADALAQGVTPFLWGGAVKAGVGAAVMVASPSGWFGRPPTGGGGG